MRSRHFTLFPLVTAAVNRGIEPLLDEQFRGKVKIRATFVKKMASHVLENCQNFVCCRELLLFARMEVFSVCEWAQDSRRHSRDAETRAKPR